MTMKPSYIGVVKSLVCAPILISNGISFSNKNLAGLIKCKGTSSLH